MKKTSITLLFFTITLFFGVQFSYAEDGSKEVRGIQEPTWLFKAGISKGKYHDRQDLGFVLKENTTLRIRQTSPDFKGELTVWLLSNDSKEEVSKKVGSQWVELSSDFVTTPFINTPYGQANATVEYEVIDDSPQKRLPIYEWHGNPADFFTTWDKDNSDFALIKGTRFQLFLPEKDKELVRTLKEFKTIDELIEHLDGILTTFDQYIGLDNSSSENRMSENRYFLKADRNGPGSAYYGLNWTANTSSSTNMWLEKKGWGTLHEIGHGYQAGFDNVGLYTGEVSNNLLAAQFQYEKFGKDADNFGWLFNFGKRTQVDNGLYQKIIIEGSGYDSSLSLRERLVLLTMLKQKAGKEAFAKMYQEYRVLAQQPGFSTANYPLPDLMNKYYSETSRFDFTPALDRWKMKPNIKQGEFNRSKRFPAVAALVDVIPKDQLDTARKSVDKQIMINSNFELVDNQTIAPLGLTGSLTLNLNIDDLEQIKGKKLRLLDGNSIIREEVIQQASIHFEDIPNGIYTIELENSLKLGYSFNQHYLYIKEKENTSTLIFEKINASVLVNQEIIFRGLGSVLAASFKTNPNHQQASFRVASKDPHVYYAGEKYISIEVSDPTGKVIYSKELEGTKNTLGEDTFSFGPDYQVKIFHDETKSRLISSDNIIYKGNDTNIFKMTSTGLLNEQLKNDPESTLMGKIDELAAEINAQKEVKRSSDSDLKQQLWAAMNALSEKNKVEYRKKYNSFFAVDGTQGGGDAMVEVIADPDALTINTVPAFLFKQIQLGKTEKAFVSSGEELGLEVIDKRGIGGGWNVQVSMTDFLSETEGNQESILKGWQLKIPKGTIKSQEGDLDNPPKSKEVIITTANTNQLIFSAEQGQGLGDYTEVLMTDQASIENAVSLSIPTYAKTGVYKAELIWSLVDGPVK
ncbi:hypothetical protein A5821_001253 [Enterococcus sp. 7F3_DIV0205]|uniref:Peptidase M60 domain-containing protein n=1 Tax=Candidatus Enterococcus palustris TaxID=1834189 RepID=A0AAQ3Y6U8_9ENTE|nr:putative mucin/carbohydrate-binding domain-containing protein [Enterococcus sp. 7F3_DIV0205]OTN85651.1 hypothetical protein A5821_001597 [Enterococcus sp. 7F3_DIV0205]